MLQAVTDNSQVEEVALEVLEREALVALRRLDNRLYELERAGSMDRVSAYPRAIAACTRLVGRQVEAVA